MRVHCLIPLLIALTAAGCGKKEEAPLPPPAPLAASAPAPAPTADAMPAVPATAPTKIAEIANAVAAGMGKVGRTKTEGFGAPMLLFEEVHNVPIGQLEQAVMLTRAHEAHGLKQVVLEGYYEGSLESGARKVQSIVARRRGSSIEEIGASLVGEGEINSVEYIALCFPDVQVVKGESSITRPVSKKQQVQVYVETKLLLALIAIGHDALTEADAKTFLADVAQLNQAPSREGIERLLQRFDEVIAKDTWATQRSDILFPKGGRTEVSIEREATARSELRAEAARVLPADFKPMLSRIEALETFLVQRSQASDAMVSALERSGGLTSTVRAMVIGIGHTERVVKLLDNANVSYAVIRANSMDVHGSDAYVAGYENKYEHRSVSPYLGPLLDGRRFNGPPQLEQSWLQAKSELYGMADDLARAALKKNRGGSGNGGGAGNGGGRGGDGEPPDRGNPLPGEDGGRFHGTFMTFNKDEAESYEENGHRVIIMPVSYQPSNGGPPKAIWVKLGSVDEQPLALDPKTSKAELALRKVIVEKGSRKALSEAKGLEQIRVSAATVMMVSESKESLKQTPFKY